MLSRLEHNEQRCVRLKIGNIVRPRGILERLTKIFRNLVPGADCAAIGKLLIGGRYPGKKIRRGAGFNFENIDPSCDILIKEIRLREA